MAKKNSLLWEIQLDNTFKGYLFGSMHVPAELAFDNFGQIFHLVDRCQMLATEIPLDKESQLEMGKHMNLPAHTSLSNLLTEKRFHKYEQVLDKSFNLSLSNFDRVLPLFLLNFMTQIAINSDPQNRAHSMDLQLWKYAQSKGLITESVESLQDHIDTLYEIPLDYQMKALKQALSNVGKFREKSIQMLDLYQSQMIHKLYTQSKKSLSGIREVLLYKRNMNMLYNMHNHLQNYTSFFVVGAGHLSGEKGLLKGLKEKGYKVIPSIF